MNKETGLSAIYAKNITPLVKGDEVKWYRNGTWVTATVKNEKVNTIYPGQLHTNKGIFSDVELSEYGVFVVSFADRPNVGTQPVDDDVVVDVVYSLNKVHTVKAEIAGWLSEETDTHSATRNWKPNHESMLAKFKEQGANTMYTGKKAEEATHIIGLYFKKIIPGNMPEFLDNDGVWMLSSFSVESALNHKSLTELSRPAGERKEDHTIDGVTTYALTPVRQYDDQETELATHFSGNNNRFYIRGHSMVKKAMVLNNDGHWIYGDCTRNDELDGGEFWKLDGNQVIEPWVGDQLDDLINPVSEGCQAGDPPLTVEQHQEILDDLAENDKPVRIGSPIEPYEWTEKHDEQLKSALIRVEQLNKPVFTQEVELLIGGGKNVPEVYKAGRFVYHGSKYSIFVTGDGKEYSRKNSKIKTRPIDNRTEKQKLMASLWDCIEQNDGDLNESSIDAFRYDLLSKFTITLNKD